MSGRRTKQKRAAESRAYLRKYLHAYVGVLRHILKRHGLPTGTSPPCHSCAFKSEHGQVGRVRVDDDWTH